MTTGSTTISVRFVGLKRWNVAFLVLHRIVLKVIRWKLQCVKNCELIAKWSRHALSRHDCHATCLLSVQCNA